MRTKYLLPFLIVLVLSDSSKSIAQNWMWARNVGNTFNNTISNASASDSAGNIYVVGQFGGTTINFGSDTLHNPGIGIENIFLVKYDSLGNALWARTAVGDNINDATSVTVDSRGNVLIAGTFSSTQLVFGTDTLINNGSASDIFVAKYDPAGNVLWAHRAEGWGHNNAGGVITDIYNNVYVAGGYNDSFMTIDTFIVDTIRTTGNAAGGYDIFIIKYDSNGHYKWIKGFGGVGDDEANALATDNKGNIYMTGYFGATSMSLGAFTLLNNGGKDIFLAKMDTSGTIRWAANAGSTANEVATSISYDNRCNLYLTGQFTSFTFNFGSSTLHRHPGGQDIFVLKFDTSGNPVWGKNAGGYGAFSSGTGIACDTAGNVFVTGNFQSPTIVFDGVTTVTNYNSAMTGNDIYVAKYDTAGTVVWAKQAGGKGQDWATCIARDRKDNFYLTGYSLSDSIHFDTILLIGSYSYMNMLLGKISDTIPVPVRIKSIEGQQVVLFPNPTNREITMLFAEGTEVSSVAIYDITGKLVYNQTLNSVLRKFTCQLSMLSDGIYIMETMSNNVANHYRFVVKR